MKSRGMAPRDESWEAEGRTRKRGRRSLWFWPVLYGAAFSIELLLAASSRRRTVSARPPRCRRRHDAIGSAVSYFSPHSPIGPRPRAKPARIRLDRVHCERPQRWPAPTAHLCRCVGQRARLSLSLSVSVCVCERASVCVCVSTCSGCVWTTTFFEILFHVVVSTDGRCWFIEFGAATAVVCVLLLPRNQERRKTSASVHKNNHHRRPGHGERAIRDDRVGFGSSTRIRFD